MQFGIVTRGFDNLNHWIGQDIHSWSFGRMYGNRAHNNKVSGYYQIEKKECCDDIVSVTVDTQNGVLSFDINGEKCGTCYKLSALRGATVYPALSLFYPGDSVEIVTDE